MLVDLLNQLAVDLTQLSIQSLNLGVQTDQRLLIGETRVEVSNWVESCLFKLLAHKLYHQKGGGGEIL